MSLERSIYKRPGSLKVPSARDYRSRPLQFAVVLARQVLFRDALQKLLDVKMVVLEKSQAQL